MTQHSTLTPHSSCIVRVDRIQRRLHRNVPLQRPRPTLRISGGTSGTVLYTYDEAGHLLGEYDASGALIEETVWLGDTPVATLRPNGGAVSIYYVHSDSLNTPRQVTRPSDNTVMWTWSSDPFGTDAANPNPSGAGPFAFNLRFPGQIFDGEAGLHQNGFRDYDPAIGRYPTADPSGLAGGLNPYRYSAGNPISNFDPLGLFCNSGGGWTTCSYPDGPSFRLPTPPGFPAYLRVGGSWTLPPLTDPTVQISRSGFFKTDSPSTYG